MGQVLAGPRAEPPRGLAPDSSRRDTDVLAYRSNRRKLAIFAVAVAYFAITIPFVLTAGFLCLALFYFFMKASLRLIEHLGLQGSSEGIWVCAVMFVLFLVVYLGEQPVILQGVLKAHKCVTRGLARAMERLEGAP